MSMYPPKGYHYETDKATGYDRLVEDSPWDWLRLIGALIGIAAAIVTVIWLVYGVMFFLSVVWALLTGHPIPNVYMCYTDHGAFICQSAQSGLE